MPEDISGQGTGIQIIASNTFPIGFELTQFADDSDPIDIASLEITSSAMGLNGNKIQFTVANPMVVTINLITGSDDDRNMQLLAEANRAGRNKVSAKDLIAMVITYGGGAGVDTFSGGSIDEFMPSKSIASEGRFKTNAYILSFENRTSVPAV